MIIYDLLPIFKIKNPFLLDLDIKGSEFNVINEKALSKFKIIRIEYSTKIGNKKIDSRSYIIKKLKQNMVLVILEFTSIIMGFMTFLNTEP